MARQYVAGLENFNTSQGTSTSTIIQGINPGASQGFKVLRMRVNQLTNTTSAMQGVIVETQATPFPTFATATTPRKLRPDDPTSNITGNTNGAAGTAGANASANGTGTLTMMWEDSFHVFNGFEYIATPFDVVYMPAGGAAGLEVFLAATISNVNNWNSHLFYEEA